MGLREKAVLGLAWSHNRETKRGRGDWLTTDFLTFVQFFYWVDRTFDEIGGFGG
jgi:hypothetical protein